jgi:hypothetical protein
MCKSGYIEGIKEPLFAAANSGRGFVSFYGEIFGNKRIKKKYIIKGGPGTGKSSFMKKVAAFAKEQGADVEYYKCSSDPDSIDGIVINGNVAIIDGTAPHSEDMDIAGARDEIINLGMFWDDKALMERFEEITALSYQKSDFYRLAYKYLSAALELENINFSILSPAVLKEKMQKAAERIVSDIPKGSGGKTVAGIEGSLGMRGRVRYNSYLSQAKKLYVIDEYYNSSSLFLDAVATAGLRNENILRISYNHISAGRPDAVYFCESDVCFAVNNNLSSRTYEASGRVNMKRFIDPIALEKVKSELRSNFKIIGALISNTEDAMKKAGEYHFLLEDIYRSCMDFTAQNAFCNRFCEKLLNYL